MINISKFHQELVSAGIPIEGCSSDGSIDFLPEATQAHRDQAAQILAAHDPTDYVALRRQQAKQAYKMLSALRGMTPDQAEAWVQSSVTTLATAKDTLGKVVFALVALVRYLDIED